MKKWWIAALAAVMAVIVLCVVVFFAVVYRTESAATVKLGNSEFAMRVARTEDERERGLSGTAQLSSNEALVFAFPNDGTWGIWMKDMNYPIDIVWLDAQKVVRHMQRHVSPDSYPEKTFRPDTPVRYVIELKAGAIDMSRITIGSQAVFDSTKGSFE